jgi:hypothetical protein
VSSRIRASAFVRLSSRCLITLTLAAPAASALADNTARLEEDFEALRDSGVDYTTIGTICEQVARLRLTETYPAPAYRIDTGIEYKMGGRVVGELDVIVFDSHDQAVLISEVKCRRSLGHAASLAHQQLERFQDSLASGQPMLLKQKDEPSRPLDRSQFLGCTDYLIIAQQGSVAAGFDQDIGLELDEAMELRARLMHCQADGDCAPPRH